MLCTARPPEMINAFKQEPQEIMNDWNMFHTQSNYHEDSYVPPSAPQPHVPPRKKPQQVGRNRKNAYMPHQVQLLEGVYQATKMPDSAQKNVIATFVGVGSKQVQTWFQNRRSRDRRVGAALASLPHRAMGPQLIAEEYMQKVITEVMAAKEPMSNRKRQSIKLSSPVPPATSPGYTAPPSTATITTSPLHPRSPDNNNNNTKCSVTTPPSKSDKDCSVKSPVEQGTPGYVEAPLQYLPSMSFMNPGATTTVHWFYEDHVGTDDVREYNRTVVMPEKYHPIPSSY
ncbi:retinal homeobox protein Rx1-like [Branchiostoma lanceolatum]|uniref:retinal homeobox protein Rx1-like n=1 Tax=Branchiostoma lanceolatum TaxID=7740 RepID=UPI00345204BB